MIPGAMTEAEPQPRQDEPRRVSEKTRRAGGPSQTTPAGNGRTAVYSCLSVSIGSTRVARSAGSRFAVTATNSMSPAAAAKIDGSVASTS